MDGVLEVGQVRGQHEEEEAAEGTEHDDELDDEGGEADEAELDGRGDLAESFLETEQRHLVKCKKINSSIKSTKYGEIIYLLYIYSYKTLNINTHIYCPPT